MGKLSFLVQNLIIWVMIVLAQINGCKSCAEKEWKGLLELKAFLSSITSVEGDSLPSWTNDTKGDCCRWESVECDLTSGRVIGLSLQNLVYPRNWDQFPLLNLSLLYPFEDLQSLDLSLNYFGGWFDNVEGYKSLARLGKLEILELSFNKFNISILPFFIAAASLKTLILRENYMDGPFPVKELRNLRSLEVLDLSDNNFNDSLPVQAELANLNKLKALDLSGNKFSGSLETQVAGICELKDLLELDLSKNKFVGQFPPCFGSLTKLRLLDLSSNQLSGKLPSLIMGFESLEYLSLSNNRFEGLFSFNSLANLSKLKVFKISSEFNLLQIETESSWQPKLELSVIALSYCNLEKIPSFLLYQKELRLIDLSNNRFSGNFPTWLVDNNTKLEVLLLQNNFFKSLQLPRVVHNLQLLDVSANDFDHLLPENIWRIFPNLRHLNLSDNGFEGTLPSSLGEMRTISFLDLSRNNFSGELSRSFFMDCYSLQILKLSDNKFSGQLFPKSTNLTSLRVLGLDNNQFTGDIGDGLLNSSYLSTLHVSNNYLTGAIPSWMGPLSLDCILLSDNRLEGTIPVSLFNNSNLRILDLSGNMLSGTIPSLINSNNEWQLYLHDNYLTGPIPNILLKNGRILDLRNNKLSGSIPNFIDTQSIMILLLRRNNLMGRISRKLCKLSNLRLLDLAYNRLSGSIPSCLKNLSFGLGRDGEPHYYDLLSGLLINEDLGKYYESELSVDQFNPDYFTDVNMEIEFAAKRRYDYYKGRALGYMYGLDLSSNELSGEIPVELGDLQKIHSLNLSHNSLSGVIPDSFSNLKDMESLDLSFNRLYGRIPPALTGLNFLAVFSVSYNNLSGPIPEGKQFDTFNESSYIGNHLLCGLAINISCYANSLEAPYYARKSDEAAIDMKVFYFSLAGTYVTILTGILVLLCFNSPWRRVWFHLVDAFVHSVGSQGHSR